MRTWRLLLAFSIIFFVALPHVQAFSSRLDFVSDLIITSQPGAPTNHRIQFTTIQAIPPSGSITLTFQKGAFTIPSDFDYTDVDVAVWDGSAYVDRPLAATQSATEDGVAITTGTSGSITITLNSSLGIAAGGRVQIRLGTNATFDAVGVEQIDNPTGVGSYRIDLATQDNAGAELDISSAIIAVVAPVGLNVPFPNIPPVLSNGFPSGPVAAGNSVIEVSFTTDRTATCRYSTTAGVLYNDMSGRFSPQFGTTFYKVLSGFQDGTSYSFYVRCTNLQHGVDATDYVISFQLAPTPSSNSSIAQPSGGVIGSGPYTNGSSLLYLAGVNLSGFTSPLTNVTVLKDGTQTATTQSGGDGSFSVSIPGLERGTYTFLLYATDGLQRKSGSYTATFAVSPATSNSVSGIVLPPTISFAKDTYGISEPIHISGQSIPSSNIEVAVVPQSDVTQTTPAQQFFASTTAGGLWDVTLSSGERVSGTYGARARTTQGTSQSDWGRSAYAGVGVSPTKNTSSLLGDLNGDGKVNLIDFSILLTFWGGGTSIADLNQDGTVNLADFSIMLFNWTG